MSKEGLVEIVKKGHDVFDSAADLIGWLDTPSKALGDIKPINARYIDVMAELGRIEHGVYS